jgi:hypothetical protein
MEHLMTKIEMNLESIYAKENAHLDRMYAK